MSRHVFQTYLVLRFSTNTSLPRLLLDLQAAEAQCEVLNTSSSSVQTKNDKKLAQSEAVHAYLSTYAFHS